MEKPLFCPSLGSILYHQFPSLPITNHEDLCDEDVFVCFILVAMNSFLCPNFSQVASYKYFEIFEDVNNAKQYDWAGYIFDWLLDSIKSFNRGKSSRELDGATLGGCLYYLGVSFLPSLLYFRFLQLHFLIVSCSYRCCT